VARIGFIGLGNMGGPMARNLVHAGHELKVFDIAEDAVNHAVQTGARAAESVKDAATDVDFVVTMLPVGANVREVFFNDGILAGASPGTLLIDSSTIDVETAQAAHDAAAEAGFAMLDARSFVLNDSCPVPGPVPGAAATNDFKPGFMAKLMLKDLRLSQAAAETAGTATPTGAAATAAFALHVGNGYGDLDTSSIVKLLNPDVK
jgi:3-hydroxyisobutyrate dehydrogenase-like beta-hydroxyacid dehydrogenase